MERLARLLSTSASPAVVLIRLLVGGVFLSEGIQKFLFPGELGTGRFADIGFPAPGFWEMAHEARNDYAQFLGSVFLLIVGAGAWSLDARLGQNAEQRRADARTPGPK